MAIHIINQLQDQDKALNNTLSYPNLEKTISMVLGIGEFYEACKDYPILFSKDKDGEWMALALMGYNDKNVYLDDTKRFKAGKYIPTLIRCYPFMLVQNEAQGNFSLAVDESAIEPLTKTNKERALFKEDKTPSDFAKNTLDFLMNFQGGLQASNAFIKELEAWQLLVEQSANITDENGKVHTINGFFILNEEKFNHLSEAKKLEIFNKGAIPLISAHLISLSNIRRLGL